MQAEWPEEVGGYQVERAHDGRKLSPPKLFSITSLGFVDSEFGPRHSTLKPDKRSKVTNSAKSTTTGYSGSNQSLLLIHIRTSGFIRSAAVRDPQMVQLSQTQVLDGEIPG